MQKSYLNVPSYIEDANYRYKMPRLQLKIEGKGNGIKTNIVNLHEVAKALRCPDEYPLKFLGFEFGSQTIYKFKNENDVTTIINGAFQEEPMRKSLDKFIEKYILCQKCKYPEMLIKVKKDKVTGSCECCGAKAELDNTHRLATFIVKNPPKPVQSLNSGKTTSEKPGEGGENQQQSQSQATKVKKTTADELKLDSELLATNVQTVQDTFQRQTSNGVVQDIDLAQFQIAADIKSFNIEKGLFDRVCYLIFQSMFDNNIIKQVKNNSKILLELFNKVNPPNIEFEILVNVVYLFEQKNIDLKYASTVLKYFYDNELLSEEFLIKWDSKSVLVPQEYLDKHFLYSKERNDAFLKASKQIIDWLKDNQDEEEEEEEESESIKA